MILLYHIHFPLNFQLNQYFLASYILQAHS